MLSIKIKELRENARLTQIDFAKKIGVSSSTVGMWESNERTPPLFKAKAIADFFGVAVDFLIDENSGKCEKISNIHSSIVKSNNSTLTIKNGVGRELSEQEDEVLRIFENLSTKSKAEALLYLYGIEEKGKCKGV